MLVVVAEGSAFYGNFCGPGRPAHSATDSAKVEEYFETIEPFDYIDCACKEHDLCYARKGRNDPSCDALFDYIVDQRGISRWCRSIAFDLEAYFDCAASRNRTVLGSIVSTVLYAPVRLLLTPFDALDAAQAKASGELGQPCLYRPEFVKPFMGNWSALRPPGRTQFTELAELSNQEYYYYLDAANRGWCNAWSVVGTHHEDGRGVPRNIDQAIEIYKRGEACGDSILDVFAGATHPYGHAAWR